MDSSVKTVQAFKLSTAVDYNPDRVIINQLMKTRYGGVNLVALEAGQKLPEHKAPGAVTILVLEGKVDFDFGIKTLHLSEGDAFVMEAGTPHSVGAIENTKIMLVKVDN